MATKTEIYPDLTQNSVQVLNRRYLIKDPETDLPAEKPENMFLRVSENLSQADYNYGAVEEQVKETINTFYGVMRRLEFIPNSPTLMNAGRELQQLSACFVIPIEDDLDAIFTHVKETALIHKSGGGTGFSFSRLRPEGDKVKSTGGVASGPCSFIRAFDTATDVVKQGGTRRGANMGVLSVYHPDVMKFICSKRDGVSLSNFNISIAVDQEFIEKARNREEYNVFNPRTKEKYSTLNAGEVFDSIIENAWHTGDPGLLFIDRINADNPNPQLGEIESTNPCVTGDTIVYTNRGLRKIKELMADSQLHLIATDSRFHTGNLNLSTAVWESGIKPVFRLRTKEGYEVRLTAEHKVMTTNGWKPASELQHGDQIHIADSGGGFGEAGNLETGLILGWLVADGTFQGSEKKITSLQFYGEKRALAGRFAEAVNAIVPAGVGTRSTYEIAPTTVRDRDLENVNSERLTRIAQEYGITPGNKHHVPPSVFQGTWDMQTGFLQALFTADGTVLDNIEKGISVRLSSSSIELLKGVQILMLNLGIASKFYKDSKQAGTKLIPNGKGGLSEYNAQANHELVISKTNLPAFKEKVGFLLDSKNDKLGQALKSYQQGPYQERFTAHFESLDYENDEPVYDLTEPNSHSFIANGIVVSNCGEQSLLPYESCNLGSINLSRMTKKDEDGSIVLDLDKLRETTSVGVHMLDNVIDMNNYPLEQIEEVTKKTRRIGVGVMGFADMLIQMGIQYDSNEAIDTATRTMRCIRETVYRASQELAEKRGPFPEWENSAYKHMTPMRNSAPTTIAPTGTISIIAGASSGIEPLFALAYVRNVMDNTTLTEVNEAFKQVAKDEGFYSDDLMARIAKAGGHISDEDETIPDHVKRVFRTSHQISPYWHVKMQAAFQQETDNAVSKTINLPNESTIEDIKTAYETAFDLGCKGITVYRDGSKTNQVLSTEATNQNGHQPDQSMPTAREWRRPRRVHGTTERVNTAHGAAYVTINTDDEGKIVEVFAAVGKPGGCDDTVMHVLTRTISVAAQHGVPERTIIRQLRGSSCCPIWDDGEQVMSPADAIGIAMERISVGLAGGQSTRKGSPETLDIVTRSFNEQTKTNEDQIINIPPGIRRCQECNSYSAVLQEGCITCYNCGWGKMLKLGTDRNKGNCNG